MRWKLIALALAAVLSGLTAELRAQGIGAPQGGSSANGVGSEGVESLLDGSGTNRYYKLGPGDIIDVRVFGEPQFNGQVEVDEDGNIEIPFVEKPINVKCRTRNEVRKAIAQELSRYLRDPQVSVRVIERRSKSPAIVYGAVRAPQRVQMLRRVRLLEVLASAGGVTEQAGGTIQIFHTEPLTCPETEEERMIAEHEQKQTRTDDIFRVPFDVYSIEDLKLGKQEANPIIRPGDIVIVQEAAPVYITGAVVAPQGIYLRGNTSLMTAIAMVGGLRKDAKPGEIKIYRRKLGSLEPEIIKVDFNDIRKQKSPDMALQPYDIIEVPGATVNKSTILQTLLGGAFNTVTAFSTTLPLRVIY